jgi:DUF4097 and DUF4098 domain-containing protein YvlB
MRREQFAISGPIRLEVATGSGDIQLLRGSLDEAVVELRGGPENEYTVDLNAADLVVRPPVKGNGKRRFARTNIKVYLPEGSATSASTASGDITVSLEMRRIDAVTATGEVRLIHDVAEDVRIKTASGDIKVERVGGDVSISTASGDVVVDRVAGDLRTRAASGDLRVHSVAGVVEAKSVSGDLSVGVVAGSSVSARTVSGDVRLGIPSGRTVDLDVQTLSGDVINRINKSNSPGERRPLALSVRTVSGDLRLESA